MDADLVASGRYARLEIGTVVAGKVTTSVTVGFVQLPDGALLVAATDPEARWARALSALGAARVRIADRTFDATATELPPSDPARSAAIRDLILRYGTPSEGLGRGPVFRLDPTPST